MPTPITFIEHLTDLNVLLDKSSMYSKWTEYFNTYFIKTPEESFTQAFKKALDYNRTQIKKPLNNDEFDIWCSVVNEIRLNHNNPKNHMGGNLRLFYEQSDKCIENINLIKKMLNSCMTVDDVKDFISLIPDDYSILNDFYKDDAYEILDTFFTVPHNSSIHKTMDTFNYLARYVYTPKFISSYPNFNPEKFINQTNSLVSDLDKLMISTFNSRERQIDFLISSVTIIDIFIDDELPISDKAIVNLFHIQKEINLYFERVFPEQYKHFQILKTMDVHLSPEELVASFDTYNTPTTTIDLPEFR